MNKSRCAFRAIGGDHGIEQENRSLKVLGGVKGILLNKAALHRFSLASPELNRICDEFFERNNVMDYGRRLHYQLTGSINLRVIANVSKLSDTMEALDVLFRDLDTLCLKLSVPSKQKLTFLIIILLEMTFIRNLKTKESIVKGASGINASEKATYI